ncbi:MAG: S8 family peptidase [Candidatus Gastranaerophilales bacterium]|nr:S8 family peptidase [Candidatus Gastranaerophilales bacterium]
MQRVRRQIEIPDELEFWAGRGINIAVLDTGIGWHPDLEGRLLAFRDFVNRRNDSYDDNGHGTHVCGILCGSGAAAEGRYRGIAPGGQLIVGKVLDQNGGGDALRMLEGLAWVLEESERYHIRILNLSIGLGDLSDRNKEQALLRQLELISQRGITVICAAGNSGPKDNSIAFWGESRHIIAVGCHDGIFCRDNPKRCETYSARGKALAPLRKPDIVAPGTGIISCNAFCQRMGKRLRNAYVQKSGTSMSTPIISGVAALYFQKYPSMSSVDFRQKLTLTATDLGEEWNKQGWGMVNARRLLE